MEKSCLSVEGVKIGCVISRNRNLTGDEFHASHPVRRRPYACRPAVRRDGACQAAFHSPAANATVAKPTKLTLTFSEKLLAPLSGVDLTMTGMPGMADHAPMPIKGFRTAVDRDGKTLVVTTPRSSGRQL